MSKGNGLYLPSELTVMFLQRKMNTCSMEERMCDERINWYNQLYSHIVVCHVVVKRLPSLVFPSKSLHCIYTASLVPTKILCTCALVSGKAKTL